MDCPLSSAILLINTLALKKSKAIYGIKCIEDLEIPLKTQKIIPLLKLHPLM